MGQAAAACRPECSLSSCKNLASDATSAIPDLEVLIQETGCADEPLSGCMWRGVCCPPTNEVCGVIKVEQRPSYDPSDQVSPAAKRRYLNGPRQRVDLAGVPLVAQSLWSAGLHSSARSHLLIPHIKHRFSDYYSIGRKLGEGSFGDVHDAVTNPVDPLTGQPVEPAEGDAAGGEQRSGTPRTVAVKIFRLGAKHDNRAQPGAKDDSKRKHDNLKKSMSFEAERVMLGSLEHPHIVRMYECFQDNSSLFIVLELCRGGELYSRLVAKARESGSGLPEPLSKYLFRQMLYAVSYLHGRQIVHRDIKTENFLLVGELGTPEGDTLKLCDFGTAARLTESRPRCMENIGTLSYTAPEVYMNKGAALAADAWSLGVVLYVILTGTNPFRMPGRKVDREETVRRIKAGDFEQRRKVWANLSSVAQDFVKSLLVLQEDKRLTCHQALELVWVAAATRPLPDPPTGAGDPEVQSDDDMSTETVNSPRTLASHAPHVIALLMQLSHLAYAQRLTLQCCAMATSEAELTGDSVPWRELFLALDADQDGRLSFSELSNGLSFLASRSTARTVSEEHLVECAQALDLDASGFVEWVEWLLVAMLASRDVGTAQEPLSTAYRLVNRSAYHANATNIHEEPAKEPIVQTIAEWLSDWGGKEEGTAFTLEDMRHTVSSLGVAPPEREHRPAGTDRGATAPALTLVDNPQQGSMTGPSYTHPVDVSS